MPGLYLDTSALGRVLLGEPDAVAVLRDLAGYERHVSSRLTRVELRRLALRRGQAHAADQLLTGVALVPVDESLLATAESLPPVTVASLDAIHLATAVRLAGAGLVDAVVTYDVRLAEGARHHGLSVFTPE
jgi:uncharacterized protein